FTYRPEQADEQSAAVSQPAPLWLRSRFRALLHEPPQRRDVLSLGVDGSDRDSDHPATVEDGGSEIGAAGAVYSIAPRLRVSVELFAAERRGFVAHTYRLQRHGSNYAPTLSLADLLREPLRVFQIPAETLLQPGDPLLANQKPKLERAETAAQRNSPIAQILDLIIRRGPQITRIGRHDADKLIRIPDII